VLKEGGSRIRRLLKIIRSETSQTRGREYFATLREAKESRERAQLLGSVFKIKKEKG
jgi:hypothetical protein